MLALLLLCSEWPRKVAPFVKIGLFQDTQTTFSVRVLYYKYVRVHTYGVGFATYSITTRTNVGAASTYGGQAKMPSEVSYLAAIIAPFFEQTEDRSRGTFLCPFSLAFTYVIGSGLLDDLQGLMCAQRNLSQLHFLHIFMTWRRLWGDAELPKFFVWTSEPNLNYSNWITSTLPPRQGKEYGICFFLPFRASPSN